MNELLNEIAIVYVDDKVTPRTYPTVSAYSMFNEIDELEFVSEPTQADKYACRFTIDGETLTEEQAALMFIDLYQWLLWLLDLVGELTDDQAEKLRFLNRELAVGVTRAEDKYHE